MSQTYDCVKDCCFKLFGYIKIGHRIETIEIPTASPFKSKTSTKRLATLQEESKDEPLSSPGESEPRDPFSMSMTSIATSRGWTSPSHSDLSAPSMDSPTYRSISQDIYDQKKTHVYAKKGTFFPETQVKHIFTNIYLDFQRAGMIKLLERNEKFRPHTDNLQCQHPECKDADLMESVAPVAAPSAFSFLFKDGISSAGTSELRDIHSQMQIEVPNETVCWRDAVAINSPTTSKSTDSTPPLILRQSGPGRTTKVVRAKEIPFPNIPSPVASARIETPSTYGLFRSNSTSQPNVQEKIHDIELRLSSSETASLPSQSTAIGPESTWHVSSTSDDSSHQSGSEQPQIDNDGTGAVRSLSSAFRRLLPRA